MVSQSNFPKIFLEGADVPTEEIGVECRRENSVGQHPPPNRLHVWWARRPLIVSRFAVVGSLVGDDWSRTDILELCGIPRGKDPVAGQQKVDEVRSGARKERVKDPYGYPRAYSNPIFIEKPKILETFFSKLNNLWNVKQPAIIDMFSGGGSIPLEAVRLNLNVSSVELNPVACVIQKAIFMGLKFGFDLSKELNKIGYFLSERIKNRVGKYFPRNNGEDELCYIWVRSVRCKECGFDAPLTPNWWLDVENGVCFRAIVKKDRDAPEYRIGKKGENGFDPEKGSVVRGTGVCIRCGQPIPEDYIKKEAQAGRMGHQLAAVGYKMKGQRGRKFRPPNANDIAAYEEAKKELARLMPEWEKKGLVPNEEIPHGLKTEEPIRYGMRTWAELFNPRQLLVHLTTLEELKNYDWSSIIDEKMREAVRVLLALALDKTLDYNSILNIYHPSRVIIAHVFSRHDFAFSWNYGEIDGAGHLFRFGVDQVCDAYEGLVKLLTGAKGSVGIHCADARNLHWIKDESVHAIITDPPYYANVMYSELSDFFYVWMKRSIGDLFPEWFSAPLTDKDSEAVANAARFRGLADGRGSATKAAEKDYELKMTQAWKEAFRVLVPGGVLTIMFNHKELTAWDALARSIIQAGFTITASWAVSTESEHSLHIREKQAVKRTIILVARKFPRGQGTWWDDVRKEVRQAVRDKLARVLGASPHTTRIDLLMSAYGEGLRVISSRWPVRDSKGDEISIRIALAEARAALQEWYFEARLGHSPAFDNVTKLVLYAIEGYGSREADFDDVHKYGLALGISIGELEEGAVAVKKKSKVLFLDPQERSRRTIHINPERDEFRLVWDRIQAAALKFESSNEANFRKWLKNKGFLADDSFMDACRFLASEGPADFLETKMAKFIHPPGAREAPAVGYRQTRLEEG